MPIRIYTNSPARQLMEDRPFGIVAWTDGTHLGEVYVVGVHPAYQGRGLAGPLTGLGLAHLRERGCTEVILYVDGENAPARATYERAGLSVQTTDRVYAPVAAGDAVG